MRRIRAAEDRIAVLQSQVDALIAEVRRLHMKIDGGTPEPQPSGARQ